MANPDLILIPFAQDGEKNTIPLELSIGDPVYRASFKVGFPPDTRIPKDIGGEGPDGLDFNGVLNILSQAVVFLQKGNAYQFDASMAPYPIGALVRSNDNLTTYQSTVPNNSNNPNSNMTGWRVYNGSGFIVDDLTTNDGTKALSAKQGKVIADGFTGTKTTNGYQKLYGGLIMQWGRTTGWGGSVNFSQAFNSVFFVTASPIHDVDISDGQASQTKIKSFSNTSFSYSCGVESGGNDTFNPASLDFTWFAIGY